MDVIFNTVSKMLVNTKVALSLFSKRLVTKALLCWETDPEINCFVAYS